MKPEEVIRAIDLIREMDVNTPITQVDIANAEWGKEMAIEALEKQIPKKPIESEFTPLICPDCEAKVTLGQRYCENCGQKINWEE